MEIQEQIRKLSGSDRYRSLVLRRRRVTYLLTGIAVVQYALYFMVIAWGAGLAGTVWPAGGAVSVLIWLTVLVHLVSIAISAGYVWWTGRYYDPERKVIMRELGFRDE